MSLCVNLHSAYVPKLKNTLIQQSDGGSMARRGRIFESQKATGDAVIVAEQKSSGDVSIKPQSRVLTARWPQGGWVWNRPVAVLVKRGEQEKRISIVDVTRVAQLALYGAAVVFTIIGLIQMVRRGGKQK
jgi:hypothetical protein